MQNLQRMMADPLTKWMIKSELKVNDDDSGWSHFSDLELTLVKDL